MGTRLKRAIQLGHMVPADIDTTAEGLLGQNSSPLNTTALKKINERYMGGFTPHVKGEGGGILHLVWTSPFGPDGGDPVGHYWNSPPEVSPIWNGLPWLYKVVSSARPSVQPVACAGNCSQCTRKQKQVGWQEPQFLVGGR